MNIIAAGVWRNSLQTLLVSAVCGGVMGLLSGCVRLYPGKHSPRLGIPGLHDAAPLGLVCATPFVAFERFEA